MVQSSPRHYFTIASPARVLRESVVVPHAVIDHQRWTGSVTLTGEVLSPVHAGTGYFEVVGQRLVRLPVECGGRPVVPGSSIKGACRQVYELLTDSDAPTDGHGATPSAAGALFGTLGQQGRLGFDDAVADQSARLTEVRLSTPYAPRNASGRRFYALPNTSPAPERSVAGLALPIGAQLTFHLRLRNVTEAEIGGVLCSLGVGAFVMRLGGGKHDGYGCVRIDVTGYRLRAAATWDGGAHVNDAVVVGAWRDRCLAAFQPSANGARALALLRQRLLAPARLPVNAGGVP